MQVHEIARRLPKLGPATQMMERDGQGDDSPEDQQAELHDIGTHDGPEPPHVRVEGGEDTGEDDEDAEPHGGFVTQVTGDLREDTVNGIGRPEQRGAEEQQRVQDDHQDRIGQGDSGPEPSLEELGDGDDLHFQVQRHEAKYGDQNSEDGVDLEIRLGQTVQVGRPGHGDEVVGVDVGGDG